MEVALNPAPAGKELDLKFAVALEEPDPASGVQAKLRARLRVRAKWAPGARAMGSLLRAVLMVATGLSLQAHQLCSAAWDCPLCLTMAPQCLLQAEAQDLSPRITAHHPAASAAVPSMPPGHPSAARALPLPMPLPVAPSGAPASRTVAAPAAAPAYRPTAAHAAEVVELVPPMQHLLVVQHGAGAQGRLQGGVPCRL